MLVKQQGIVYIWVEAAHTGSSPYVEVGVGELQSPSTYLVTTHRQPHAAQTIGYRNSEQNIIDQKENFWSMWTILFLIPGLAAGGRFCSHIRTELYGKTNIQELLFSHKAADKNSGIFPGSRVKFPLLLCFCFPLIINLHTKVFFLLLLLLFFFFFFFFFFCEKFFKLQPKQKNYQ